jgi:heme exporter protein A
MMRLSASRLGCVRGSRDVFRDVSFELSGGEMLAVVGPNGAGKSSLLRLLVGLVAPSAGEIALAGGDADLNVPEQAHYLGHLDALKASLTVSENLGFWISYLGAGAATGAALAAVGLAGLADLPAGYLSAGQRRRLSLARLVAAWRPIWLLDEPTSALDAAGQERLLELMRGHLAAGGMIIAATHGPLGIECPELQLGRSAPSPHSPSKTGVDALMQGEGWGGGPSDGRRTGTPTPNPSPQGGGEPNGARGDAA